MATRPVSGGVEANCAICGAPPDPECPHEGERLQLALNQAMERWDGLHKIRKFVLDHARNSIIQTYHTLRSARMDAHRAYLQTLPYYTLYHRFSGNPPLDPAQFHLVHSQIQRANQILQQGVDQDWRTSCQRYPQVLDYYFSLAEVVLPDHRDPRIFDPRFGDPPPKHDHRRLKERRNSGDAAVKEHRRKDKDRRRSRGRTPPPHVPMPR